MLSPEGGGRTGERTDAHDEKVADLEGTFTSNRAEKEADANSLPYSHRHEIVANDEIWGQGGATLCNPNGVITRRARN